MKENQRTSLVTRYKNIETDMASKPILQTRLEDVAKFSVNWYLFSQNETLTDDEVEELVRFESCTPQEKEDRFLSEDTSICEILIKILSRGCIDRVLQHVLYITDTLIKPDITFVRNFIKMLDRVKFDFWQTFATHLNNEDMLVTRLASRILSKLSAYSSNGAPDSFLIVHSKWLLTQIETTPNEYIFDDVGVCQLLLRLSRVRKIFQQLDLIQCLTKLLKKTSSVQIQYQVIFCLWLIAFEQELVDTLVNEKIILFFADILKDTQRDKLIRIILAACRNMVEKSKNQKDILALLVYNKFTPIFQSLNRRVFDDEELNEDLNYLTDLCVKAIQDLSTYDEYAGEVLAGKLEWSPVHKSDKFWRENAIRLIETDNKLLSALINILQTSTDPVALAVACHDIGQFVRHYTRGKIPLERLGGKSAIFNLLNHSDPNVKYEALIALQKLLVQNWDFLGKQMNGKSVPPHSKQEAAIGSN